ASEPRAAPSGRPVDTPEAHRPEAVLNSTQDRFGTHLDPSFPGAPARRAECTRTGVMESWRRTGAVHRLIPNPPERPWKCGQFAVRKMRHFACEQVFTASGRTSSFLSAPSTERE